MSLRAPIATQQNPEELPYVCLQGGLWSSHTLQKTICLRHAHIMDATTLNTQQIAETTPKLFPRMGQEPQGATKRAKESPESP